MVNACIINTETQEKKFINDLQPTHLRALSKWLSSWFQCTYTDLHQIVLLNKRKQHWKPQPTCKQPKPKQQLREAASMAQANLYLISTR